ncbi:MAG: serine/threonine protein kinase, partial [Armatimonadota bacterium]
ERLGQRFRSSPSLVGDRVYLLSETGESIVAAAARKYRELATGQLGEPVYSSPAFARRRMYIRGERHLYCIGEE